jgi:hypothetical protein
VVSPSRAEGVVLNASLGGLRIAIDKPLYVNDFCHLKIATDEGDGRWAKARVKWVKEMPDGWVVGLELAKDDAKSE